MLYIEYIKQVLKKLSDLFRNKDDIEDNGRGHIDDTILGDEYRLHVNKSSWIHWHEGNDIDVTGKMPLYRVGVVPGGMIPAVDTPVIVPVIGTYDEQISVSIVCSTPNVNIYYTLDNTSPTRDSVHYDAPFTIYASTTVRARAYKDGYLPSEEQTAKYTLISKISDPIIYPASRAFTGALTIKMACWSRAAQSNIYYTVDNTTPTIESPVYAAPIIITGTTIFKAMSVADGYHDSNVVEHEYILTEDPPQDQVLPVHINPQAPQYAGGPSDVSMVTFTPLATIHYTLDGNDPTEESDVYTVLLWPSVSTMYKARAYKDGMIPSEITSKYIELKVDRPSLAPDGGVYEDEFVNITISSRTPDLDSIYYTLNGNPVTPGTGILYEGEFTLYTSATVRVKGYKAGWSDSDEAVVGFILNNVVASPVISLPSGTYVGSQLVTITCDTEDADIYYTTDGTTPSAGSIPYTEPVTISASSTLKAIGIREHYTDSAIASSAYTIVNVVDNDINVVVVYVEHETSMEDPLAPGFHDTAQYAYDTWFKYLGRNWDEWENEDNFAVPTMHERTQSSRYPSLPIWSELYMGSTQKINVIHAGLVDGTVTPHVSTHPYGYYVSQAPNGAYAADLLAMGISINVEGWATWGEGVVRLRELVREIMESGYLSANLDECYKYDKLTPGRLDCLIIVNPPCYRHYYFDNNGDNDIPNYITLPTPCVLFPGTANAKTIYDVYYDNDRDNFCLLRRFLYAMGYERNGGLNGYRSNILNNIKLKKAVPKLYTEVSLGEPYLSAPMSAGDGVAGLGAQDGQYCNMSPLVAASLGLTRLQRQVLANDIKATETHVIKNRVDSHDFLCIQSPNDPDCWCALYVHYPKPSPDMESTDYVLANPDGAGVYATVFKLKLDIFGDYYIYPNQPLPIASYAIDSMTARYEYADINADEYIGETGVLNHRLMLIDDSSATGISSEPFGIEVYFEGWSADVNGIQQATVRVSPFFIMPKTITLGPDAGHFDVNIYSNQGWKTRIRQSVDGRRALSDEDFSDGHFSTYDGVLPQQTHIVGTGNAVMRIHYNGQPLMTREKTITWTSDEGSVAACQVTQNPDHEGIEINVLVLYAQHEESFPDPAVLANQGLTKYYDNAEYTREYFFEQLSMTMQEWRDEGYFDSKEREYWTPISWDPFIRLTSAVFGDIIKFNVIHVGQDGGIIADPYIVPREGSTREDLVGREQHPYGYYVFQTPRTYPPGIPFNPNGFENWEGEESDGRPDGRQRNRDLITEMITSGYLEEHLDPSENYCKLVVEKIDLIIISPPTCYRQYYYGADTENNPEQISYHLTPYEQRHRMWAGTPSEQVISMLRWEPEGVKEHILHEWIHYAFRGYAAAFATMPLFDGPAVVFRDVPDTYVSSGTWNTRPRTYERPTRPYDFNYINNRTAGYMGGASLMATHDWRHEPMMAASHGLTRLDRVITIDTVENDGIYEIEQWRDTYDALVLKSPHDPSQYCIIFAHYSTSVDGHYEFPGNEMYANGIYAVVFKGHLMEIPASAPRYTYGTYNACALPQYGISSIEDNYYHDIDNSENCMRDGVEILHEGQPIPNPALVLLDHSSGMYPSSSAPYFYHGIGGEPFGATIKFLGWKDDLPGEHATAVVSVQFNDLPTVAKPRVWPDLIQHIPNIPYSRWWGEIDTNYINHRLFEGQYDVTLLTSTPDAVIRYTVDPTVIPIPPPLSGEDFISVSTVYSAPLQITEPSILTARAYRDGYASSNVLRERYIPIISTPEASLPEGDYVGVQEITITCDTPGVTILYRVTGAAYLPPATKPAPPYYPYTEYTGEPIIIDPHPLGSVQCLAFRAYRDGWNNDKSYGIMYYTITLT